MRVLLDECLPKRLKAHFAGHKVTTVPEAGWAGKKNGELLRVASGEFDAFITVDSNLVHQQHLVGVPFIVIVLLPVQTDSVISCPSFHKSWRA